MTTHATAKATDRLAPTIDTLASMVDTLAKATDTLSGAIRTMAGAIDTPGESMKETTMTMDEAGAARQAGNGTGEAGAAGPDMGAAGDPRVVLRRALEQGERVLSGVGPAQAEDPTPCTDWTVRQLVEHLVGALRFHGGITAGTLSGAQPPRRDSLPPLGEDWVASYRQAQEQLLAAWQRPGALEATYQLPFATLPGAVYAQFVTVEVVTHTWDLASATGQRDTLDDDLGARTLEIARRTLPSERTPQVPFKAMVDVPADAPVYDRLAAYMGRRP